MLHRNSIIQTTTGNYFCMKKLLKLSSVKGGINFRLSGNRLIILLQDFVIKKSSKLIPLHACMARDTCVYFSVVMSHLNFKFFTLLVHIMMNLQTSKLCMDGKYYFNRFHFIWILLMDFCTSKGSKNSNNPLQFIIYQKFPLKTPLKIQLKYENKNLSIELTSFMPNDVDDNLRHWQIFIKGFRVWGGSDAHFITF